MNHIQTKRLTIAKALNSCLNTQEMEDIHVREICHLSEISRSSFYRYFYSLYEVPVWLFMFLVDTYIQPEQGAWAWKEVHRQLFAAMLDWKPLFIKTYGLADYDSVFEHSIRLIPKRFLSSAPVFLKRSFNEQDELIIEYHSYVQMSLIAKWIRDGMQLPPDKLSAILLEFMPPIMKEFTGLT